MGHKRIDETMLYVHVAENHRRDIPADIVAAAAGELDPDSRHDPDGENCCAYFCLDRANGRTRTGTVLPTGT